MNDEVRKNVAKAFKRAVVHATWSDTYFYTDILPLSVDVITDALDEIVAAYLAEHTSSAKGEDT
jgi:hypothetical protein